MQLPELLVSWYFEPSHLQRITSQLKTMFNLAAIYSAHKSTNHKLSINPKIRHDPNLHKTKHTVYTNIGHKIFKELVPLVSPLLKKYIRLAHSFILTIPSIYLYQIF